MEAINTSSMATLATGMNGADFAMKYTMAVTRQIRDQREQQAQALVNMIEQSNAVMNGRVDTYA